MKLVVVDRNASGHVKAFNKMKLDTRQQYVEGSDDETRNFVRDLPRVEPYTGANNVRVLNEGVEYTLSYKFYTAEEKKLYDQYRKDHKGGSGTGSTSKKSEGAYQEALNLVKALEASGCPKEFLDPVRAYAETLKPVDPAIRKAQAALQGLTEEQKAAFLKSLLGN